MRPPPQNSSQIYACGCLYLLLRIVVLFFLFFLFVFFFSGEGISVFYDLSYPIANQLYCVCLCYFVLWFAANKFDLI